MEIIVKGQEIDQKEKQAYVKYLEEKYNRKIASLEIKLDDDYVDLSYHFQPEPFERIRRITGYLTGTLDSWNNSKRAEEADRVKHSLESSMEMI
nr:anaerobic ribonucleoside-triphosphate reductase [Anaerovorax odorimutans]